VSVYPIMLDGEQITAVVIGGGSVALRKARALVVAGAKVTVVAPELHAGFGASLFPDSPRLVTARYDRSHLTGATIVFAATDDAAVNRRVADDARRLGLLVNVADDPDGGSFTTPAVHRSGDLTVAVSAGRVPSAAAAIRDVIGRRFDGRYAEAIADLRRMRDRMLSDGRRHEWKVLVDRLISRGFCRSVETGTLGSKLEEPS
jgi:precorrin-2 dehydrogenase/sirohydrochlorin ferrochelatase